MALTHVIQAAHYDADERAADVLATLINADQAMRIGLGGSAAYTGKDVLRLGRILQTYATVPEMPATAPLRVNGVAAVADSLAQTAE